MATARANLETTISADMSQFSATMRKAGVMAQTTGGKIAKSMGSAAKSAAKAGTAFAAMAGAVGGAALIGGIKAAADLGGKLSDLSARTGIAAGELAVLGRAFEDNGVSADKIGGVINKLQKSVYDFGQGSEKAAKPFQALGISFAEISSLSPAQQFELIQKKISEVQDPAERAALAMQLFGKSGGELLTLFADGGAITKAGEFLGTQAEILNRRSGTFDEISDILARAGSKLQGFTVGVLDAIADDLLPALQYFDQLDLAAMGQAFGESLKVAADWVYKIWQVFDRVGTLIGDVLGAAFSPDFWRAASELIWGTFATPLQKFSNALAAIFSGGTFKKLITAFFSGGDVTAEMGKILSDSLQQTTGGEKLMQSAAQDLEPFIGKLVDDFKGAFEPLDDLATVLDRFKKPSASVPQIDGSTYGPPKPVPQIDGTTYGPSKDLMNKPEIMGPPKALADEGNLALAEISKHYTKKATDASKAGFKGLGGLYQMQADKAAGIGPGQNNIFAQDRERLGIASGLTTGGLGEKRRLKTSADNKEAKKQLSLAEKQVSELETLNGNVKQALTVS